MPLPALPASNTLRFRVFYEGPMGSRSLQLRFQDAAAPGAINAFVNTLLDELADLLVVGVSFVRLEFAAKGSNVFLPGTGVTLPVAGTAVAALNPPDYPDFVSFVGRGAGGRKTRLSLYGTFLRETADYRFMPPLPTELQNVVDTLNSGSAVLADISGAPVVWYPYLNEGVNAYYQRRARRVS